MRLGVLGPAQGDLAGLARAAEHLLNSARAGRVIYLGGDDALERTVALWAESLVGGDPSDDGLWDRALDVAVAGSPPEADAFGNAERARTRLKSLEELPSERLRSVEMFGDRVAILIHDKALLDEEDIYSASFLIYGKSDAPIAKMIGPRWFLSPGPIGAADGGSLVLDGGDDDPVAVFFHAAGKDARRGALSSPNTATVRRGGDPGPPPGGGQRRGGLAGGAQEGGVRRYLGDWAAARAWARGLRRGRRAGADAPGDLEHASARGCRQRGLAGARDARAASGDRSHPRAR